MATISASVGVRCPNRTKDVKVVQRLLNDHLKSIGRSTPLEVDGLVGKETISAIVNFQSAVVGMTVPDGEVSPGKKTIKTLARKKLTLIQLPSGSKGSYSYVGPMNQFGTRKTVQSVKSIARVFYEKTGVEIGVGHISKEHGGAFPPHKSHQRGVDVDFRPLRQDGKRQPVRIDDPQYSRKLTRTLVETLQENGNVERILFNDDKIKDVKFWPGHDNHLHVRFAE